MANSNLICHLYTISLSAQAFISAAGNMSMCKDGIKPFKDVLSNKLNGRISRNLSRICHSEIKHKKEAFRFSSKKMTAIFRTINMFCSVIFSGVCGGTAGNTPIIVWLKYVLNKNTILSYRISSTEYKLLGRTDLLKKYLCVTACKLHQAQQNRCLGEKSTLILCRLIKSHISENVLMGL